MDFFKINDDYGERRNDIIIMKLHLHYVATLIIYELPSYLELPGSIHEVELS